MSMKKISELQLETTANYQALSKLNVRFWNQDLNTAELRFLITRDNFPLSLSNENVKVIIALEQGNNFISSEDFEISSEVDGVASFLIPNDFMSAVSGEVTGQVYVGTLDSDEVIVQRKFTFQVENDLLSSIPSELKLQYIKTFSDLRQEVQDRITALENEFVVMEDYVVAVNQATTDGLNALNNLVNAKTVEYNDNHADKLALINNTVDGYVQDFLDQRTYIDTKYADFQTAVLESGLVTVGDSANWQKHKLTNNDGTRQYIKQADFIHIDNLAPGYYEITSSATPISQGLPSILSSAILEIDVMRGIETSGRKQYKVKQNYDGRTWEKTIHTGGTANVDWKEIAFIDTTNVYEKVNGSQAKANTAENNAKAYTDTKLAETHKVLFSGSVNGVGKSVNLTDSIYNYKKIVISGVWFAGTFHETVLPAAVLGTIQFQNFNMNNASGDLLFFYEMQLDIEDGSKMTIAADTAYDFKNDAGNGSRNSYTITRIEGFN